MLAIGGRVFDHAHKPITGCSVKVLDEQGDLLRIDKTGNDGSFSIEHKSCSKCMLQIVPSEDSGLATALLDNVPGDKNRNFIVELHHGFEISGRIEHSGKGLKGLIVKAVPIQVGARGDIHGGGFAITGKDGHFMMTLTPGMKRVSITNSKYDDLVRHHEFEVNVEAPTSLAEISLPKSE